MAQPAEVPVPGLAGPVLKAGLLLAGLLVAGVLARHEAGNLHVAATPLGAFILVVGGGGLTAVGVPRQVVAFAAGFSFGPWTGLVLAMAGQMLGCAANFWVARRLARRFVQGWLVGRAARLQAWAVRHPFSATLTMRLLPVGSNSLFNLLAGVSTMRALPFFAATFLGYLPQTGIFLLAGGGVQLGHRTELWLGMGLFVLSAAVGAVLARRQARR